MAVICLILESCKCSTARNKQNAQQADDAVKTMPRDAEQASETKEGSILPQLLCIDVLKETEHRQD